MSNVVGDDALTAFAPALPSPLRKAAPYGRPVHRLGDYAGRSPGSRVVAQLRPAFPVAQWPYGRELAAHSYGGSRGLLQNTQLPRSLFRSRVLARETSTLKCSAQFGHKSSWPVTPWRDAHFYPPVRTIGRSRIVFSISRRTGVLFPPLPFCQERPRNEDHPPPLCDIRRRRFAGVGHRHEAAACLRHGH